MLRLGTLAASLFVCMQSATAETPTIVSIKSLDETKIQSHLLRPTMPGKRPAVIALHGCGGPVSRKTGRLSKRHEAWARILVAEGYVVVFPDSFGSRGHRSLCRVRRRPVKHRHRRKDAHSARRWLSQQSNVDPDRISVLGWSNGGSTALRLAAARDGRHFHKIIAFYPGCRSMLDRRRKSKTPLMIIMGAADDWTPPEPCVELVTE